MSTKIRFFGVAAYELITIVRKLRNFGNAWRWQGLMGRNHLSQLF
jgi:hypothetical protein